MQRPEGGGAPSPSPATRERSSDGRRAREEGSPGPLAAMTTAGLRSFDPLSPWDPVQGGIRAGGMEARKETDGREGLCPASVIEREK